MPIKTYKIPEETPMSVGDPAVAYRPAPAISRSDEWNPNVPFIGTQEEWWEHFHNIEAGNYDTWEEHQNRFSAWKKELLVHGASSIGKIRRVRKIRL